MEVSETAAEPVTAQAPETVAEQGIRAEQPRVAELVVWEVLVIVAEQALVVAQAN